MNIIATILAVEKRKKFAEQLYAQVAEHVPVRMSLSDSVCSLDDAFNRWRDLLKFATLQNADWHLFLEDDQELYPPLWEHLEYMCSTDTDVWYLANRAIAIGQIGTHGPLQVNRIKSVVPGSHGLLTRVEHLPKLLEQKEMRPIDFIWWEKLPPHQYKHFQVLNPVMVRHVGRVSTLHQYKQEEQLHEQPPAT